MAAHDPVDLTSHLWRKRSRPPRGEVDADDYGSKDRGDASPCPIDDERQQDHRATRPIQYSHVDAEIGIDPHLTQIDEVVLSGEHTLMGTRAARVCQPTGHQHLVRPVGCDLHDEPHAEMPVPVDVVGRDRTHVHLIQSHHVIDGGKPSTAPHGAGITNPGVRPRPTAIIAEPSGSPRRGGWSRR
ncbi:Uncharacterised protein [Clostridioides difficile]|nr:Uncharacterised protein [Clostridioides difficile]